jgi:pilus assembly protein Flp/PilA
LSRSAYEVALFSARYLNQDGAARRHGSRNAASLRAPIEETIMDLFILKTWIQAKFNTGDERGASMVEYGLLLALIAVIAIVAVKALGTSVSTKFSSVNSSLN